ncbi:MAG: head GIN domain-containing protein, partial [Pyrinomonadaceae bacterium]
MKKIGILIFIIAIIVGVVFANLFSFGRITGKLVNFSVGTSVKGSGNLGSEVRTAEDFQGVDVSGVFKVEVTAGKEFSVQVEADDNLLPYVRTEVEQGILHIEMTEGVKSENPLRVLVTAPDIESVEASGSTTVSVTGIKNSSLEIDASGHSKVKVDGETDEVSVAVSGSSSVDAEALKARTASVDSSGASSASVFVTEQLASNASGASKIFYSGNPSSVAKSTSG